MNRNFWFISINVMVSWNYFSNAFSNNICHSSNCKIILNSNWDIIKMSSKEICMSEKGGKKFKLMYLQSKLTYSRTLFYFTLILFFTVLMDWSIDFKINHLNIHLDCTLKINWNINFNSFAKSTFTLSSKTRCIYN